MRIRARREKMKFDVQKISREELCSYLKAAGIDENEIRPLVFDTVDSTNTVARGEACKKIPTLVVANAQTGGRGRLGRSFACPDGAGVYMSLLIYPDFPPSEASRLTCLAAVATARAIEKTSELQPYVKWVNDLYVGNKKLCGILTEGSVDAHGGLAYAVIGIGINVHRTEGELPEIATSIEAEGGRPTKRARLIAEVVAELLPMLTAKNTEEYFREYIERAKPIIGKEVTVTRADESYPATVLGIEQDGRLSVKDADGKIRLLGSGEVSLSFI